MVRVAEVKKAEIARDVQVVAADQEKRTQVIRAEGEKARTVTIAEGSLAQAKLHTEGVRAEGEAQGAAATAVAMATVNAQTALAKEIGSGSNEGYQKYLIEIRVVEKDETIGVANTEALKAAKPEIKVMANNIGDGFSSVLDVLTPKGGLSIGGAIEALAQTPAGAAIVKRFAGEGTKAA